MRRLALALALLAAVGCSSDPPAPTAAPGGPCRFVDAEAIEGAIPGASVSMQDFEHEESGDGTWCLYRINGLRVELQAQPGSRAIYEARRAAAGGAFSITDLDEIGDAAFRHTNGIPGVTVLAGSRLLELQRLDLGVPPTTEETILKLALKA